MFNISICCDDSTQMDILCKFSKDFSLNNHLRYKLSKYNSFDHLLNSPPKNLDVLFLSIDSSHRQSVYDIHSKFKLLYQNSQIIFMPEIMDFMLNGFCLKDFRYILKPLKYIAFEDELSSCINDLKGSNSSKSNKKFKNLDNIFTFENFQDFDNPLAILSGVSTNSILFIESRGNHCIAYTSNRSVKTEYTIDQLEKKLCDLTFFKCHDSFIINIKKISKLSKSSIVINSKVIPIDEKKFKPLKDKLLIMLKII